MSGLGCGVGSVRLNVQGVGCRVLGVGCKVWGVGLGVGFGVKGSVGCRVLREDFTGRPSAMTRKSSWTRISRDALSDSAD